MKLIIAAVDRDDPRPVWYCDWGTDHGAAMNNLRRALDRVLAERGAEGYAKFKSGCGWPRPTHLPNTPTEIEPPFALWVDTFRPELDGRRWYHRFSAITAKAGGFDVERDLRRDHGPLGPLYPLNTTHPQKEGDTMTFLYLVPTGMNDPQEPTLGQLGRALRIESERFPAGRTTGPTSATPGTARPTATTPWLAGPRRSNTISRPGPIGAWPTTITKANHHPAGRARR